MTGPSLTFKVTFARTPESRLTAPPAPPCAPTTAAADVPDTATVATPIARMLALGHHVERLIDAGVLKDYADAARQLGMAKSHMTHVTNLLRLAPEIQEELIFARTHTSERCLRTVAKSLCWDTQQAAIRSLHAAPAPCQRRSSDNSLVP